MGYNRNLYKKLKVGDYTNSSTVAPAGDHEITFAPDHGFLRKILSIYIDIPNPVGSTAGNHYLHAYWNTASKIGSTYIYLDTPTGTAIKTYYGEFVASTTEKPSNSTLQSEVLLGGATELWASKDYPIYFYYYNNTDVNQTGSRRLIIRYLEMNEGL